MQVELEHLHRYFLAREAARGLDVLDLASGEGYGSAFLAQVARSVVGVDCDAASIAHADAAYSAANLRFVTGDARCLPLPDAGFDLVVSFETLEHMGEHDAFLAEVRRVLRPGGRLLLSTPERDTYSPADAAANPFHVHELARSEFGSLLQRHFPHVTMLGQRPMLGSAIFAEDQSGSGGLLTFEQRGAERFEVSAGLPRAVYLVALASDQPLTALPGSLYIHTGRVEEAARAEAAQLAQAQQGATAALKSDLLGMRAGLAALREDVQCANARQAEAETSRDAALRSLSEAESSLRSSVELLRAAESELRSTRAARAEAQAYAHHVQSEYDRSVAALVSGAGYTRHVEEELAIQRARANQSQPLLHATLASLSWQATWPLRRSAAAHPLLRRVLRVAGKVLPWVRSSATVTIPILDQPPALPAAVGASPPVDAKATTADALSGELQRFLQEGERLTFPKQAEPAVSVLVVLYGQAHLTLRCLQALQAQLGVALEVILVDNASSDATVQLLDRLDGVRIIRNRINRGFLLATNQAAAVARGRTLLLLNSDAFPRPGALAAALTALESEPGIGAVGARLILPSGLLQEAGSIIWADGSTEGYGRGLPPESGAAMFRRDVDYCSGAFLLTPRATWERLGGFDEGYAPAYYEEADYCMRLREAGLRVVYEPAAAVDHYEFGSEVREGDAIAATRRNADRFRLRHAAALVSDHLSRDEHDLLAARYAVGGRGRRLLMIDDLAPLQVHGSGLPRARAIAAGAVAAGWSVTHYPLHESAIDWDRLRRELPSTLEVIGDRGVSGLAAFLAERAGHYDVILVSRPHNMVLFRDALSSNPAGLGKARLIYDAEAIYAVRDAILAMQAGQPMPPAEAERRVAEEIHRCTQGVQGMLCVNEAECALARQHLPPDLPLYRLALAPVVATAVPGHAARLGFLFVGRLLEQDAPNWLGLTWFLRECWPAIRHALPGAALTVVGQLHPDHAMLAVPGVRLIGPVEDLQPYYDAARVFVAPVQSAAGVSIKILEATAAGLPVACTTLMALQLGWQEAGALATADDPAGLAAAAVALHEDAAAWQARRDRAQALLRRDFDPELFQKTLVAALEGRPAPAEKTP